MSTFFDRGLLKAQLVEILRKFLLRLSHVRKMDSQFGRNVNQFLEIGKDVVELLQFLRNERLLRDLGLRQRTTTLDTIK
jgi:hypothetical protein